MKSSKKSDSTLLSFIKSKMILTTSTSHASDHTNSFNLNKAKNKTAKEQWKIKTRNKSSDTLTTSHIA